MHGQRLQLTDTTIDVVSKMSKGNPGAMTTLMAILADKTIDPDNIMGGMGVILSLDSIGIYGTDIYVLHSDICGGELAHTLAVLRAVQLGFFNGETLQDACSRQDYSGRSMVPVDELYEKVTKELPNFDAAE